MLKMRSDQKWWYTPVILEADVHEFKDSLGYVSLLLKDEGRKEGKRKSGGDRKSKGGKKRHITVSIKLL